MELISMLQQRFSVRSYASRPVETEKLQKLLQIVRCTPTAVNRQPQRIYVLQTAQALEKVRAVCKFWFDAPVILMVCQDESRAWHSPFVPGYHSGEVDAAICCDELMLAAWSLGLGSCWVGYFDPAKLAQTFDLPAQIHPVALLHLGYAAEDCKPLESQHAVSRPMEELVEYR